MKLKYYSEKKLKKEIATIISKYLHLKKYNFFSFGLKVIILIIILIIYSKFAFAISNIDPNYKYAWGDTIGWVNFGCDNCNLNIGDDKITGYAWSQNYGWINFSPSNGGVLNDGNGNLSGYAWGENLGWIDFSNVRINPSTGEFSGYAIIIENPRGTINFDCLNCKIKTYWRTNVTLSTTTSRIFQYSIAPPQKISTSTIRTISELITELFKKEEFFQTSQNIITPLTLDSKLLDIPTKILSFEQQQLKISTSIPFIAFESKPTNTKQLVIKKQTPTKLTILFYYLGQVLILIGIGLIIIFILNKI